MLQVLEGDVWSEIMQAKVNVPKPRKERQVGPQCNCDSTDRCPPGPPGADGSFSVAELRPVDKLYLGRREKKSSEAVSIIFDNIITQICT